MLAYRVNLYGAGDKHYIITPAQKPKIEKAMLELSGTATLKVGDDIIRVSTIKSITSAQVDPVGCPDYFQRQLEAERANETEPKMPGYRKLPTEWILLTPDGKIIKGDISVKSIADTTERLLAQGDPEENKDLRFVAAKCHFKFGSDGIKQYFTAHDQIAEALRCFPNRENPGHMVVRQVYHYGIPQWK